MRKRKSFKRTWGVEPAAALGYVLFAIAAVLLVMAIGIVQSGILQYR